MESNHDFYDLPEEQVDLNERFIDETFYTRESTICVRAIKSYVVKIQDIFETCVRDRQSKIDDDKFEYYYAKIFDSLLDLRMFKQQLFKKLKL